MDFCRLLSALILLCGLCAANGILVGCGGDEDPEFGVIFAPECYPAKDIVHRLGDCAVSTCANPYTMECYYEVNPRGRKFYCDINCNCDDAAQETLAFMREYCFY